MSMSIGAGAGAESCGAWMEPLSRDDVGSMSGPTPTRRDRQAQLHFAAFQEPVVPS